MTKQNKRLEKQLDIALKTLKHLKCVNPDEKYDKLICEAIKQIKDMK